jgi:hypothetical protein
MVLRDTYIINSVLRCSALLLLMMLGSCKQSSDKTAETTVPAATSEKATDPNHTVLSEQVQVIQNELMAAMQDMNGLYRTAESVRINGAKEKEQVSTENADAVFEKSASVLGAMFITQGSLKAVEDRFREGILDQKQAQEMLNKLRMDVDSYTERVKAYKEMLGAAASSKKKEQPEKK